MEKLLAALNLPQVGEIRLVDPDDESYEEENDGSLFTIELNDRVYTMKVQGAQDAHCCYVFASCALQNPGGCCFLLRSLYFLPLKGEASPRLPDGCIHSTSLRCSK